DTINFSVFGAIVLTTGELKINDGLVIAAPSIVVSGNNASRVFDTTGAPAGAKIVFAALTIANGAVAGDGGGILIGGAAVTFRNCVIGNSAVTGAGGDGGGVAVTASNGSLTISGGAIAGNHSNNSHGGGIDLVAGATATISNCTISGNTALD